MQVFAAYLVAFNASLTLLVAVAPYLLIVSLGAMCCVYGALLHTDGACAWRARLGPRLGPPPRPRALSSHTRTHAQTQHLQKRLD